MKYSNCGASVKSSGKVKKMNMGGFMKIGDSLQKLDVNKTEDSVKANMGGAMKRTTKSAPSIKRNESGPTKPLVKPKPKPKPKPKVIPKGPKPKKSGPGPKPKPKPKAPAPYDDSGMGKRGRRFSSGGMAEDKRTSKSDDEKDTKGSKKYKRGELVEAYRGKTVKKK